MVEIIYSDLGGSVEHLTITGCLSGCYQREDVELFHQLEYPIIRPSDKSLVIGKVKTLSYPHSHHALC